ncbi:MAG: hypothetical protein EP329_07860 [Deltaproteobacteria bacterium]|nr:MAG: hypothetical protein EP329_07860 [Deltaproteobacteria bacterium]
MTRLMALTAAAALLVACSDTTSSSASDTSDADPLFPDLIEADTVDGDTATDTSTASTDTVEPFAYECEPLATEACVTSCLTVGERLCLKEWGPCVPPPEKCDNCEDDDCDGVVNDGCPPNPVCQPVEHDCPTPAITVTPDPSTDLFTGTVLQLSSDSSIAGDGTIVTWQWSVQAPPGSSATFQPSATVANPTFTVDVAGSYLFLLDVADDLGTAGCQQAQLAVSIQVYPPLEPEVGCADGEREGFLDTDTYTHIAACSGGWSVPGITPDSVVPTCNRQGGDDGANPAGTGCASADLCATGWHLCAGWEEVAAKSPTGCAGATPPGASSESYFFAISQASVNGSVCEPVGSAGDNDVFGCGNLGNGMGGDKHCGPLDRVLASTQPDSCGWNQAMPPLGPWECIGGSGSDLHEGATVTKKACANTSCSYDGKPIDTRDKGGVLCCR